MGNVASCEGLISASEAAKLLNCSAQTVKRQALNGEIPAMRVGNRWMFRASLLDSWMNKKLLSNCSQPVEREAR